MIIKLSNVPTNNGFHKKYYQHYCNNTKIKPAKGKQFSIVPDVQFKMRMIELKYKKLSISYYTLHCMTY